MSTFNYNGIELSVIRTNFVERAPVYSDDQTEYMYTNFTIDLNCIYNPYATSYSSVGSIVGELAPNTDFAIRHYLMQPRKALLYTTGDLTILEVPPINAAIDAIDSANGPHPISVNVTRIIGAKTYNVNYKIKCSVVECPFGSELALASNRYTIREEIDDQYRSTVITTGKAVFKSNVLAFNGLNEDTLRGFVIPTTLIGFKRRGLHVGLSSDGLIMDWVTIDEEQFVHLGDETIPQSAGWIGITKIEGTYGISSVPVSELGIAGPGTYTRINLRAWGNRLSNNFNIFQFLFRIAAGKVPIGRFDDTGFFLKTASITESIFDRFVELTIDYLAPTGERNKDVNLPGVGNVWGIQRIGNQDSIQLLNPAFTNSQNPAPPFANGTRGTMPLEYAVSAFRTACLASAGEPPLTDGYDPNYTVTVYPYGPPPLPPSQPNPDLGTSNPAYGKNYYGKYTVKRREGFLNDKKPITVPPAPAQRHSAMPPPGKSLGDLIPLNPN